MSNGPSRFLCTACCFLFISGCAGVSDTPPAHDAPAANAVSPAPLEGETLEQPRARVTGGVIFRDQETRRSIRNTESVVIAAGSGPTLRLVVTKSRYRLDVFRDGERIKTCPVALGGNPTGPKTVMGDERTPEGDYLMIPHHPSPSFGSCFYICYPNEKDAESGRAGGVVSERTRRAIMECLHEKRKPPHDTPLGGLILLHGTKQRVIPGLTTNNWTLGCIAMENEDLLNLLEAW